MYAKLAFITVQLNLSNSSIRFFFVSPGRIPIFYVHFCSSNSSIFSIRHLFLFLRSVLFFYTPFAQSLLMFQQVVQHVWEFKQIKDLLFFLLHMLYRSICHQVSNQADKLALLAIMLLLADVSPTYSSGLPQGNPQDKT